MVKQTSPNIFAFKQAISMFTPWLLLLLVVIATTALVAYIADSIADAVIFVLASGMPLVYAAHGVSNDWHGLIRTPRSHWAVSIMDDAIHLKTHKEQVIIPFSKIQTIILVRDSCWDTLIGVEDSCLVLHLSRLKRICLPCSAIGFDSVLDTTREMQCFSIKEIND